MQEVGCSFIKMSSTQLISGVSGDSEERIRDLFDLAVVSNRTVVSLVCIVSTYSKTVWFTCAKFDAYGIRCIEILFRYLQIDCKAKQVECHFTFVCYISSEMRYVGSHTGVSVKVYSSNECYSHPV